MDCNRDLNAIVPPRRQQTAPSAVVRERAGTAGNFLALWLCFRACISDITDLPATWAHSTHRPGSTNVHSPHSRLRFLCGLRARYTLM